MREVAPTGADVPVLVCEHCGASEPLPRDLQERVFALRTLGAARRWAEDPLRGTLVTWLARYEGNALATTLGSIGIVALCAGGGVLVASTGDRLAILHRQSVPGLSDAALLDLQWSTAFWTVVTPVLLVSVALYVVAAMLRARWVLRREIAPLVMASAPPVPGEVERCRRCGADLPQLHASLRDCRHCGAANVVSPSGVVRAFVAAARASSTMRPHEVEAKLAQVEEQIRRETGRAAFGALVGGVALTFMLTYALVLLAR